jgi:Cytochrome C oxidase subunit II, transmembrane domain.
MKTAELKQQLVARLREHIGMVGQLIEVAFTNAPAIILILVAIPG